MRPVKPRSTRDKNTHTQLANMSFDEILVITAVVFHFYKYVHDLQQ